MMRSMLKKWKKSLQKFDNSNEFMEKAQTKWEFLKYEIQKFTIDYWKIIAKKRKKQRIDLELN